ncbi:hypothetical protein C0991_000709, partial [Blastosporella zonata]
QWCQGGGRLPWPILSWGTRWRCLSSKRTIRILRPRWSESLIPLWRGWVRGRRRQFWAELVWVVDRRTRGPLRFRKQGLASPQQNRPRHLLTFRVPMR